MTKIDSEITITGNPTDEEVAAVVAVLTARAAASPNTRVEEPKSGWAAYWRSVGAPVHPGPGSWQAVYRG
ncbi:acyl-CoA carboxylase subunit epsilon [Microlunatus elymi]|uniref:Acyl-CoA carboxylase subunit epsilon n=1 Tax=Microlunatus elymi TaxID=2596828 RepID=A0A516PX05_9ACTN|nr:acyl-CoA carboxylase subunit epsilon [Microlunatus elymi]QDP95709.1 acyl-CoA carboxylase subunit epsilon [Microlunatus elymi]